MDEDRRTTEQSKYSLPRRSLGEEEMEGSVIVLTSVEAVFNGFHTDPDNGVLHGHDYLVEAGWHKTEERFEMLEARLKAQLKIIDHRELPEWSAEKLAVWLLKKIGCDQVKVERPMLGHRVTVCKEPGE